jgi:DNA polymerase-3 subunit delta
MGIDEFIVKLLDKKDIRDDLQKLLESGIYDEIRVINSLQTYMVGLFMFHSYIKIHGTYNVIDILGFPLPPNLAKQRAAQCIKIKLESYGKIFKHLLVCEHIIKKASNLDKNAFTFSVLIKLQYYL